MLNTTSEDFSPSGWAEEEDNGVIEARLGLTLSMIDGDITCILNKFNICFIILENGGLL